eukprot:11635404-Karenia_brevis.AAC.1
MKSYERGPLHDVESEITKNDTPPVFNDTPSTIPSTYYTDDEKRYPPRSSTIPQATRAPGSVLSFDR